MGQIPDDAIHWDSGDWIAWHQTGDGLDTAPCSAAAEDDHLARLTALQVNMLRAAKSYLAMTGQHLPLYPQIAEVCAAIHYDLPLGSTYVTSGVELMWIAPNAPVNSVDVDLTKDFDMLVVVRIKDNFTVEARAILRQHLPQPRADLFTVRWQSLAAQR